MKACRCWECRKRQGVPGVAPMLTRLWREREALGPARREQRRKVRHLEALVAHRELQVVRAGRSGSRRYMEKRERMLTAARGWLAGARRELEALV